MDNAEPKRRTGIEKQSEIGSPRIANQPRIFVLMWERYNVDSQKECSKMREYLMCLFNHFIGIIIIFVVGRGLQRAIGAGSKMRRIHGEYVFWCSVGAFALGGVVAPFLAGADTQNGMTAFAMMCLLGGWLVGTILGAFEVIRIRLKSDKIQPNS